MGKRCMFDKSRKGWKVMEMRCLIGSLGSNGGGLEKEGTVSKKSSGIPLQNSIGNLALKCELWGSD